MSEEITALPAKLEYVTRQVKVTDEYRRDLQEKLMPYFVVLEEWETRVKAFKAQGSFTDEDMSKARAGRQLIQQRRLQATKIIDAARKFIQDGMADFKNADTLWLRAKQNLDADLKALEADLKEIEETREREEKAAIERARVERRAILEPICSNPDIYPLGTMSEGDFQNLKATLQIQYDRLLEAEEGIRKLEEAEALLEKQRDEALQKENEKLQRKHDRVKKLLYLGATYVDDHFVWPGNKVDEFTVGELDDEHMEKVYVEVKESIAKDVQEKAAQKEFIAKRWTERVGQLTGALVWKGGPDGFIYDQTSQKTLFTYEEVISLDDADFTKRIEPYLLREKAVALQAQKEASAKAEREAAAQAKKDARYQDMYDIGLRYDGEQFSYKDINFHNLDILTLDDAKWSKAVAGAKARMEQIRLEEAEEKMNTLDVAMTETDTGHTVPMPDLPVTGSMKSRLTAWLEALTFPEPPGEYTGKGLKEVGNMRNGFEEWRNFCSERIKKL